MKRMMYEHNTKNHRLKRERTKEYYNCPKVVFLLCECKSDFICSKCMIAN